MTLAPWQLLGDQLIVSNSELGTWRRCPRRWLLGYYFGLLPRKENMAPTGSSILGIRLHAALEGLYGYGIDPIRIIDAIYLKATEEWPAAGADLSKEYDLAFAILEGYHQWLEETGNDRDLKPLAAEQQVVVPVGKIEGVDVSFAARLDVLVERVSTGKWLFMDHKSGASFVKGEMLAIDDQMPFYVMLQRIVAGMSVANYAQAVDGGLYNMLKRSKRTARATGPFYERKEVGFNDEQIQACWLRSTKNVTEIIQTRRQLDAVFASSEHADEVTRTFAQRWHTPRKSAMDCDWSCNYSLQCPLMDDGSRWEDAVEHMFQRGDPYAYYGTSMLDELRAEGRI